LELKDATFDTPQFGPDVQTLPERPKLVRQFVPLPPMEPPAILGSRPPSFQVTDTTGQLTITDRGADRELVMLVRYCGDQRSLDSVMMIAQWNAGMPDSLRQRVRAGVLADPRASDLVPPNLGIPIFIDPGQAAARSLELEPGALLILDRRGEVAWSQSSLSPVTEGQMVRVGAIVGDLLNGVDVPRRVREQWEDQVTHYRQILDPSLSRSSAERIHLD
jgi:hypothetical protein